MACLLWATIPLPTIYGPKFRLAITDGEGQSLAVFRNKCHFPCALHYRRRADRAMWTRYLPSIPHLRCHRLSLHPVTFLAQTEAGKELKEWELLSCAAANNAIRVTDCQEDADLRLMMMRARSSPRARTHTPGARRMTHLKCISPPRATQLPVRPAEIQSSCRPVTPGPRLCSSLRS